jgi:DNA polymerase-1
MTTSKLVIIDGNAILHRAFHALPPLTTKRGEPINAVYGLVSMLLRVISDLKPTHIAICFDRKEPTFRHKAFKAYQAQRPSMANELSSQFEKAKQVIDAFGIPAYEKAGYEADDVIGTLALQATKTPKLQKSKNPIREVVIVTGDRDQLQLVTNRIKVYMPVVGMSQGKMMGEEEVRQKMGVSPSLVDDYKALVGDPSDNYPGVAGIGPKSAIALLDEYGSLDSIYKHLKDIPKATAQKLKDGRRLSEISKKLATIVKNVPVSFKIEDAAGWDIDSPKVLKLFSEFGFKTLTERVKKVGKEIDEEKQMKLI